MKPLYNTTNNRVNSITKDEQKVIRKLFDEGKTIKYISKKINRSMNLVSRGIDIYLAEIKEDFKLGKRVNYIPTEDITVKDLNYKIALLYQQYKLYFNTETNNPERKNITKAFLKFEIKNLWYADIKKVLTSYVNFKRLLVMNNKLKAIKLSLIVEGMKIN